jgi:hypothetical protein
MVKELIKSTGDFDVIHSLEIAKTKILVIQQLPSLYSIHAVRHQSTKKSLAQFPKNEIEDHRLQSLAASQRPPF